MALKYRAVVAAAVVVPLVLVTGCARGGTGAATTALTGTLPATGGGIPAGPAPGPQSISETGSTLLAPLMSTWASTYHQQHPNVTISTGSTGSKAGDRRRGNYEYAIVSTKQPDAAKARDIKAFPHWAITLGNSAQYLNMVQFRPLPQPILLAAVLGFILLRIQRWLTRRTHRMVNLGLFLGTVALVASVLWLAVAFVVARADLQRGEAHGSAPAEQLAQAAIYTQQARSDEVLNLISRSGDSTFVQDFNSVRGKLGPGPGTLLTTAASAAPGGAAARWTAAAARDELAWYGVNTRIYQLDQAAQYFAETQLVISTKPGGSGAGFGKVENDLSRAIAADQVMFRSSANSDSNAYAGLAIGIIVTALIMAAGCAWGLARRIAEYR